MAALSALFGGAGASRARAETPVTTEFETVPFSLNMSAEGPICAAQEVAQIQTLTSATIETIQVSVPDGEIVEVDIKRNRGESLGGTFVVEGSKTHRLSPAVHIEAGDLLTLDIERSTVKTDGPITVTMWADTKGKR